MIQNIFVIIAILVLAGIIIFISINKKSDNEKLSAIKNEIYMLMLQAEKAGFINEEKFDFVADRIESFLPKELLYLIPSDTIQEYIEMLYSEFKDYVSDTSEDTVEKVIIKVTEPTASVVPTLNVIPETIPEIKEPIKVGEIKQDSELKSN